MKVYCVEHSIMLLLLGVGLSFSVVNDRQKELYLVVNRGEKHNLKSVDLT